MTFGFTNAFSAILLAATVIFLTRSRSPTTQRSTRWTWTWSPWSGLGYFAAITSLVYASFTFIFFALEGSIMAQGLNLGSACRYGSATGYQRS